MAWAICRQCGRRFETGHGKATLCSSACRRARMAEIRRDKKRNPATLKTCSVCGKPFAALPGQTVCTFACSLELKRREQRASKSRPLCAEAEKLLAYLHKNY